VCSDQKAALNELCSAFDEETNDGRDMSRYTGLLNKAVASIEATFRKRTVSNLMSGRGGLLNDVRKQVDGATDFDLITWMVIRYPPSGSGC